VAPLDDASAETRRRAEGNHSEEGHVELLRFAEMKRYLQVFLEFMAELPEDVREKDADGT